MQKRKNYIKYIALILLMLICIVLSLFYKNDNISNNILNAKKQLLYDNIGIDISKLNIIYLNVGQADSVLITMGEDVMLIDAGNENDGNYIVEFLNAQGITDIDYLIETHSDDDHSGGIKTIVQNLNIDKVYMPQSAIAKSEIKDIANINVFSDLEQTYSLGQAEWKVLNVDNSEEADETEDNDTSIVIQLNHENNKFLFMGDATNKVEKQLLNDNKLEKIDALKVGHHGSNSSSSKNFLDVIRPTYSIISVNNSEYKKHPSQSTIERLKAINSEIYRTDVNGTVWITSDGNTIKIKELNINMNGGNKIAMLLENREYSLIFYCNMFPALSTTV